jgi:hypothetical protein
MTKHLLFNHYIFIYGLFMVLHMMVNHKMFTSLYLKSYTILINQNLLIWDSCGNQVIHSMILYLDEQFFYDEDT